MTRKKTTEEFIAQAKNVHGEKYSYRNVEYNGSRVKVRIACNIHKEDWLALPNDHLYGSGCPKCAAEANGSKLRKCEDAVRSEIYAVHGNRYSYHQDLGYVNKDTKIDIHCNDHGWFSQTPRNHVFNKAGCPTCADGATGNRCRKTSEKFIEDARHIHGNLYNYSKVNYIGGHNKLCIICDDHGEFWQEAASHLSGRKCPECSEYGFKLNKSGYLYVLRGEEMTKVGITNNPPRFRCKEISRDSGIVFTVMKEYTFAIGEFALLLEQRLLEELRKDYKQVVQRFGGSTECFYNVDIPTLLNRVEELIASQTKEHHSSNNQAAQAA